MSSTPEIIRLDNGLQLELHDESKVLVGDRWTVVLVARMAVAHGQATGTYEQRRERVFVSDEEKDATFGELRDVFLSSQLAYLSRPDFAERFVLSR